jgi:hypothetical protein
MLKDKLSHSKNEKHFCKTLTATETPSSGVDLKGFSAATVICTVGAITNIANSPTPSWTLTLQESDSASTGFTAVDDDDALTTYGNNDGSLTAGVFATIDAADEDDAIYTVGYIGTKRYIRVVATAADTPGATPISVVVQKEALQKPQDDE